FKDDIWNVDVPYPLPAVGAKVKVTGKYGLVFSKASTGLVTDPVNGVLTHEKREVVEPAPEEVTVKNKQARGSRRRRAARSSTGRPAALRHARRRREARPGLQLPTSPGSRSRAPASPRRSSSASRSSASARSRSRPLRCSRS